MPLIAIVAASPLLGDGARVALAGESGWEVSAPVPDARQVDAQADAVVAIAADAREAGALHQALASALPLVLLADMLPATRVDGDMPLARLPLDATAAQLRAAVHAVLTGLHAWSPLTAMADERTELPGEPLTPRELEVLELLAKGLSNRDIAGVLGITAHTAKFHVAQILAKIGAATRAEAVLLGIQRGLIGV